MTADPPPAPKRAKVVQATNRSAASTATHHAGPSYAVTGLHIRDHTLRAPLDHSGEGSARAAAAVAAVGAVVPVHLLATPLHC